MVGFLVTFGVLCLACEVILAWDRWDRRREAKAWAQRRHPANWNPAASRGTHSGVGFTPATEAAIVQAIAIIDDGKSVVAEAERIVREAAT